ncbi:MAG TPA: hypothetical protein DIW64_01425 [Cellvibrio sp.]|nr:hypothetical protein [Cellvibrio sp.]
MGTLLTFKLLRFVNSVYATRPNLQPPIYPNKKPIKDYPTSKRQPKLHLITTLPIHAPQKNRKKKPGALAGQT